MRARTLDETERVALVEVLARIEHAAEEIAAEHGAEIRAEKERGGRFSYITFRAYGFHEADELEAGGEWKLARGRRGRAVCDYGRGGRAVA